MPNLQGVSSLGIELSYKSGASYSVLDGLQEVPELGGEKEKLEITTLADSTKRYRNGIKDYGDLAYKFLYDNSSTTSNYRVLKGFDDNDSVVEFKISYPDGTSHEFRAQVGIKLDGAAVNGVLTFTANLSLQSGITTVNPVATQSVDEKKKN
ncbi:MAG: phage tail tube protein [Sarcina sp.]